VPHISLNARNQGKPVVGHEIKRGYLSAILLNPNVRQMRARVRTRPIIKIRNRSFGRNRSSVLDDGARSISLAKFDAVRIELPIHHVKRIPHRSPRLRRHFASGE